MQKNLIAYFSRKGNNYVGGNIINLSVGNTEIAAKKIQSLVDGDLLEIKTVKPYSADYTACTEEAKRELQENARPEITGSVPNMADYDVIYLGYPNWRGTMPMAVFTFLESYDFSSKTVIPFCTHEGSGMGKSENDVKELCPKATVLRGLAIKGGGVNSADKEIKNWIKKISE